MSNWSVEDTEHFVENVYSDFEIKDEIVRLINLDQVKLFNNQALYAVNYKQKEIVYSKGVAELLGYNKSEFNFSFINSGLFCDKQKQLINSLTNAALDQAVQGFFTDKAVFTLLFRAKDKGGFYRTILRQTGVYEKAINGAMLCTYSLITDLTGIVEQDQVSWSLDGTKADIETIRISVMRKFRDMLSPREWQVIKELKLGKSSQEIAESLKISRHTVDTHRRKMLKKIGVCNTVELLNIFF